MRKLTAADYRTMPWKNGAGVTTELAIEPASASLDDFEWRISSAQVRQAGPFSRFDGIDRSLAIIAGNGLLWHGERASHALTRTSQPLAFTGEEAVHAALTDGPVVDFNVMTRRTRWSHTLHCLECRGIQSLRRDADMLFVYCADGARISCSAGADRLSLATGEAAWFDQDDSEEITIDAPLPARIFIVQLTLTDRGNSRC